MNGSDDAAIVYHEYAHGLSNRLVVTARGSSALGAFQSRMMGEAWSDFYANDLLNAEGTLPDTAAPAEVTTGAYVVGGAGIRAKPMDCPVDPAGDRGLQRQRHRDPVLGGYTYGDIAVTFNTDVNPNDSPHNGGEVWAETLWDIRTARRPRCRRWRSSPAACGCRSTTRRCSTCATRSSQQAVAMRSAVGAADDYYDDLWPIFAARGMGAGATTPSANSTNPTEAYDLPSGLRRARHDDPRPLPGRRQRRPRRAGRAPRSSTSRSRASASPTCPA